MLAVRNEAGRQEVVLADLKREFRAKSSVHAQMGKLRLTGQDLACQGGRSLHLQLPQGLAKMGVVQCGLRVLK